VRAVIHAESAFRESVISRKGAVGLMQLMPATARDMGVKDSLSPTQNIHGGVKYLAYLLKLYGGNETLALAAYNAGPGAVKRYDGIPPFAETETYVKRVRILHKRYKDALAEIDMAKAAHQASQFLAFKTETPAEAGVFDFTTINCGTNRGTRHRLKEQSCRAGPH